MPKGIPKLLTQAQLAQVISILGTYAKEAQEAINATDSLTRRVNGLEKFDRDNSQRLLALETRRKDAEDAVRDLATSASIDSERIDSNEDRLNTVLDLDDRVDRIEHRISTLEAAEIGLSQNFLFTKLCDRVHALEDTARRDFVSEVVEDAALHRINSVSVNSDLAHSRIVGVLARIKDLESELRNHQHTLEATYVTTSDYSDE